MLIKKEPLNGCKSLRHTTQNDYPRFPGEVHPTPSGGILITAMDDVINWARSILYGHLFLEQVVALSK